MRRVVIALIMLAVCVVAIGLSAMLDMDKATERTL